MTGRVKVLPGYRLAAVVADVSGITTNKQKKHSHNEQSGDRSGLRKDRPSVTMNSQMNEVDLEKIGLVSE